VRKHVFQFNIDSQSIYMGTWGKPYKLYKQNVLMMNQFQYAFLRKFLCAEIIQKRLEVYDEALLFIHVTDLLRISNEIFRDLLESKLKFKEPG
jgi:hypothetical protein